MVYLVSKNRCVVGVFTNRTWMMAKIEHLTRDLHIKGTRKNVPVNAGSIGVQMVNGYLPLYNDEDAVEMRIWKLNENTLNPQLKEVYNEDSI